MNKRPIAHEETTVVITQEQLKIGRRVVETSALRLRKQVEEVPMEVREPLVDEFVDAQRVPIGRVLEQPIAIRQEGDVTIVPVIHERLVVRKELVLVEEIRLTRRREVRESLEQVTLRREKVVIERLDPATQQWLSQDEG